MNGESRQRGIWIGVALALLVLVGAMVVEETFDLKERVTVLERKK